MYLLFKDSFKVFFVVVVYLIYCWCLNCWWWCYDDLKKKKIWILIFSSMRSFEWLLVRRWFSDYILFCLFNKFKKQSARKWILLKIRLNIFYPRSGNKTTWQNYLATTANLLFFFFLFFNHANNLMQFLFYAIFLLIWFHDIQLNWNSWFFVFIISLSFSKFTRRKKNCVVG